MTIATFTLQFFDTTLEQKVVSDARNNTEQEIIHPIRCRACGHIITTPADRISVNQQHEHTCRNPAGFEFTFGCFRNAPGCQALGPATYDHTWFSGYSWQLVFCNTCSTHLGWLFRNSETFFALIINRLKYQ